MLFCAEAYTKTQKLVKWDALHQHSVLIMLMCNCCVTKRYCLLLLSYYHHNIKVDWTTFYMSLCVYMFRNACECNSTSSKMSISLLRAYVSFITMKSVYEWFDFLQTIMSSRPRWTFHTHTHTHTDPHFYSYNDAWHEIYLG